MNLFVSKWFLTFYFTFHVCIYLCSGFRLEIATNVTRNEGEDITFSCIPDDRLPIQDSFVWKKDGNILKIYENPHYRTFANASLQIKKVNIHDIGTYQCFESEESFRVISKPTYLHVKEELKFVDPISYKKLELNSVGKLLCKARGSEVPTVYWRKEGFSKMPLHVREKDGVLTFDGVRSIDAGRYTCIASIGDDSPINTTVTVEVGKAPKFNHSTPNLLEVALGSTILIECSAVGDPTPVIHWYKNKYLDFINDRITAFSNGSLLITNAVPSDQGKYGCMAGNSHGFERTEFDLKVHKLSEDELDERITKTMMITVGGITLYILFVLALVIWCRIRNEKRKAAALIQNSNGSKPDITDLELKELNDKSIKLTVDPDSQSTESVRESLKNSQE